MKQRKEKAKTWIILFMVILMVGTSFSVLLFGFGGSANSVKENGIKFTTNGEMWLAKINGKPAAFSFLPSETASINITGQLPELAGKLEIDVTSIPEDKTNSSIALAQHQMGLTLSNYNIFVRWGFTGNNSYNMPIIKCSDHNPAVPVIMFKSSNETRISIGECIMAEASSDLDMIRVKDKLVYLI